MDEPVVGRDDQRTGDPRAVRRGVFDERHGQRGRRRRSRGRGPADDFRDRGGQLRPCAEDRGQGGGGGRRNRIGRRRRRAFRRVFRRVQTDQSELVKGGNVPGQGTTVGGRGAGRGSKLGSHPQARQVRRRHHPAVRATAVVPAAPVVRARLVSHSPFAPLNPLE